MTQSMQGLAQVAISVRDLDRSVAFYRDAIGLPFLFAAPPRLAFLQCGETRVMLEEGLDADRASHPALYFRVDRCRAAAEALAARGVTLVAPPHVIARLPPRAAANGEGATGIEVWLAHFEDPDGHLMALMSEEPAPAAPATANEG